MRLSAPPGPAADRLERAEVRPFGKIGLAQDHRASGAEVGGHGGVPLGRPSHQSERSRAGLHPVAGIDVVLQQHGDAVQGTEDLALGAHRICVLRDGHRVRVQLDHRVDAGPVLVELVDPLDVVLRQLHRGQLPRSHHGLQLRDGHLVELVRNIRASGKGDKR